MKRIFVLLICLILVLGCLGCSGSEQKAPTAQTGVFTIGYGRANVTPEVSVGLTGYGNTTDRMSDNILSYLYITCLAVTDAEGNTVLLYGLDATKSDKDVTNAMRGAVSRATEVPKENIMISATHTHSGPEITDPVFQNLIMTGAVEAAQQALADRQEATLKVGTVKTEGLTFVRHYVQENGNVVGDNFGDKDASPIVGHTTEEDSDMQLMHFVREGKDIVLMNFQAHPTWTGSASSYDISADFVGACREKMETELDCNFLYFTGAAGNLNAFSRIAEEKTVSGYKEHGSALAQYAIDAMDTLTEVSTGAVEIGSLNVECVYDYDDGDLGEYVSIVTKAYTAGGGSAAAAAGRPYGINSIYHARAIIRRARDKESAGYSSMVTINTVSFGDVAFAMAPFELFCDTGKQIKEGSPYDMTFVLTLANDHNGYIATETAFEHGCYEVDNRYFVRGTAENVGANMVTLLEEVYKD